MGKYAPLRKHLERLASEAIPMSFREIEQVLGTELPASANTHRAWWSNNPSNNVMTREWLAAGYESEQVDLTSRKLVFRRAGIADRTQPATPSAHALQGDREPAHPLYGAFKDVITLLPGVDLTAPTAPEWGQDDDAAA